VEFVGDEGSAAEHVHGARGVPALAGEVGALVDQRFVSRQK